MASSQVSFFIFALKITLWAYPLQFGTVLAHIIGDCFYYGIAANARLSGAFIGSVPVVGTMLNR